METTNNFQLKKKIKSFYEALMRWLYKNELDRLKSDAVTGGLLTILHSTLIFITAVCLYNDYDSKSGNSTLSTLLNQTKTENSTTFDYEKQNLKSSTTDGDDYVPKQPLGFTAIMCGIILYVHLVNSSFMVYCGALKEYKHLLLPWIISAPTSIIGCLISFFFHPYFAKNKWWVIYFQIYSVYVIVFMWIMFFEMMQYYALLAERDRVKRARDNSRPIPAVLPGEEDY